MIITDYVTHVIWVLKHTKYRFDTSDELQLSMPYLAEAGVVECLGENKYLSKLGVEFGWVKSSNHMVHIEAKACVDGENVIWSVVNGNY